MKKSELEKSQQSSIVKIPRPFGNRGVLIWDVLIKSIKNNITIFGGNTMKHMEAVDVRHTYYMINFLHERTTGKFKMMVDNTPRKVKHNQHVVENDLNRYINEVKKIDQLLIIFIPTSNFITFPLNKH